MLNSNLPISTSYGLLTSIKISVLTLLVILFAVSGSSQTFDALIDVTGDEQCTIACGGICGSDYNSSSNATWQDIHNFTDPIPAENACFISNVRITIRLAACDADSDDGNDPGTPCDNINTGAVTQEPFEYDIEINGEVIGTINPTELPCNCNQCQVMVIDQAYPGGLPGYNFGGANSFDFNFKPGGNFEQSICVSDVSIELTTSEGFNAECIDENLADMAEVDCNVPFPPPLTQDDVFDVTLLDQSCANVLFSVETILELSADCANDVTLTYFYNLWDDENSDQQIGDDEESYSCSESFVKMDNTPPNIVCPPDVVKEWPALETDKFASSAVLVINVIGIGDISVELSSDDLPPTAVERPRPPYDNGQTIPVEMVSLELTGSSPLGPVIVRLREDIPSPGTIVAIDTDSNGELLFGDSFFDVFVEIETNSGVLNTGGTPIPLQSSGISALPPVGSSFATPPGFEIPLFEENGQPAGFIIQVIHNVEEEVPCDGEPTVTDNCDTDIDVVFFDDVTFLDDCPNVFLTKRTFIATDDCGNSASCMQFITLTDFTPPGIVCPPDLTVEWGDPYDPSAAGTATATDNCGVPAVTFNDETIASQCPFPIIVERTWTATDVCDNTSQCVQTILIGDTSPPDLECPPDVVKEWPGLITDWFASTATIVIDIDGSGPVSVDLSSEGLPPTQIERPYPPYNSGDQIPVEMVSLELVGSSPLGPVIVRLREDVPSPGTIVAIDTDSNGEFLFGDSFFDVFVEIETALGVLTTGEIPIQLSALGIDALPPVGSNFATAPGTEIPLLAPGAGQVGVLLQVIHNVEEEVPCDGVPEVFDNCDIDIEVTWEDELIPLDDCPNILKINRTFTATDDCGNSTSCVQMITYTDTTPPDITCPPDVVKEWPAQVTDWFASTATIVINLDGNGPLTVDLSSTGLPPTQIERPYPPYNSGDQIPVEMVSLELAGDSPLGPVIVRLREDVPSPGTIVATDTDSDGELLFGDSFFDVFVEIETALGVLTTGEIPIPLSALGIDALPPVGSNFATSPDTEIPLLSPDGQVVGVLLQVIHNVEEEVPCDGVPEASDTCDDDLDITWEDEIIPLNDCPNVFKINRTFTATDDCDNTATCVQMITLTDTTPPEIECPPDATVEWGDPTDPEATGYPDATDNCLVVDVTFTDEIIEGECPYPFHIKRTWKATDVCGLMATCVQWIWLSDHTPPDITCPPDVVKEWPGLITDWFASTATIVIDIDGSGPVPVDLSSAGLPPTQIERPYPPYNSGDQIPVEMVSLELSGDSPLGPVIVRLREDVPSPGTIVAIDTDSNGEFLFGDSFFDVFVELETALGTLTTGAVPIPLSALGIDALPPVGSNFATGPGTEIPLFSPDGQQVGVLLEVIHNVEEEVPCDGVPEVFDNCDVDIEVTWEDELIPLDDCPNILKINRTFTAIDDCGNEATCVQMITFTDTTPPDITCPPDVVKEWPAVELDKFESVGEIIISLNPGDDECDNGIELTLSSDGFESTIIERERGPYAAGDVIDVEMVQLELAADLPGGGQVLIRERADKVSPGEISVDAASASGEFQGGLSDFEIFIEVEVPGLGLLTTGETPLLLQQQITSLPPEEGTEYLPPPGEEQNLPLYDEQGNLVGWLCHAAHIVGKQVPCDGEPEASDTCDDDLDITWEDEIIPLNDCPNVFKINRTFTATDDCDNTATCVQMITLTDTTPPEIECPPDATVEWGDPTDPEATGYPDATDNCLVVDVTFTDEIIEGECPYPFHIKRTWKATDVCGLMATCVQWIWLSDHTPPDITCPPDVVKEWPGLITDWFASTATIVIDIDGSGPVSVDLSSAGLPPTQIERPYPPYNSGDQIPVEMVSLELVGSSPLGPVIVRLREDVPSPGTIVAIDTDSNGEFLFGDSFFDVFVEIETALGTLTTGAVPIPLSALGIDALPPVGSNFATGPGTEIPLLSPDGQQVGVLLEVIHNVEEEVPCDGVPEVFDNCDVDIEVTWEDELIPLDDCPNILKINRTFTATDDCGNSTSCVQMITYTDTTPPDITCPPDVVKEWPAQVTDWFASTATIVINLDGNGPLTVDLSSTGLPPTQIERPYPPYNSGDQIPVEMVSLELAGDSPLGPVIVRLREDVPSPGTIVATDTDSDGELLFGDSFFDVFVEIETELGVLTTGGVPIPLSALGIDALPPVGSNFATSPNTEIPLLSPDGQVVGVLLQVIHNVEEEVPCDGEPEASDTCDDDLDITWEDEIIPLNDCPNVFKINRTFTATDDCDNTATCVQMITLTDTTPPEIECPPDATVEWGDPTDPEATGYPDATDNCLVVDVTFTDEIIEGECPYPFHIKRTWKATDVCGLMATCVQWIWLSDHTPPDITCPPDVVKEWPGLITDWFASTATIVIDIDGSGPVPVDLSSAGLPPTQIERPYPPYNSGDQIPVEMVSLELSGDSPLGPVIVRLREDVPSPGTIVAIDTDSNGEFLFGDSFFDVFVEIETALGVLTTGEIPIQLSALGIDALPPVGSNFATAPGTEIPLLAPGAGQVGVLLQVIHNVEEEVPCDGVPEVFDNCDIDIEVTWEDELIPLDDCPNILKINRTFTAIDDCGNEATCVQMITFTDTTPPDITCPPDVVKEWPAVELDKFESVGEIIISLNPGDDECDNGIELTLSSDGFESTIIERERGPYAAGDVIDVEMVQLELAADLPGGGQVLIRERADKVSPGEISVDAASASGEFQGGLSDFEIFIEVEVPGLGLLTTGETPLLLQQQITSLPPEEGTEYLPPPGEEQNLPLYDEQGNLVGWLCHAAHIVGKQVPCDGEPEASDTCDDDLDITWEDEIIPLNDCPNVFKINRTFTATDDCDNTATCVQMITLTDTTPPEIECPPDATVEWGDPTDPEATGYPDATDNCLVVDVTFTDEIIEGECPYPFHIKRTWKATDVCGLMATCVQWIWLSDHTPPDITCPPDVVKEWPGLITDWFASTATIVIDIDGSGPVSVDLSSAGLPPTQIERPYPPYNSGDQIPVEMVSLELVGSSPLGPVIVRLREDVPSPGTIVAIDTDSNGEFLFGDSFFDVFVEIETALGVLTTGEIPIQLSALGIDALPPVGSNFATAPGTEIPLLAPGAGQVGVLLQVIHNVEEEVPCDGVPEVFDNCDVDIEVTWEDELIPLDDCPNILKINRTFTAIDDCGNEATCVQMITFTDTTPPDITCPPDVVKEWPAVELDKFESVGEIIISLNPGDDECDNGIELTLSSDGFESTIIERERGPYAAGDVIDVEMVQLELAADLPGGGQVLIRERADKVSPGEISVDAASASGEFQGGLSDFEIFIEVEVPGLGLLTTGETPLLLQQQITSLPPEEGTEYLPPPGEEQNLPLYDEQGNLVGWLCHAAHIVGKQVPCDGEPEASDTCDDDLDITWEDEIIPLNDCPNVFKINRTFTATDDCDNTATCVQMITLTDTTPPEIECPPDATVEWGDPTDPEATGYPDATDNCLVVDVTFTDEIIEGECPYPFHIKRTWKATDVCGLMATCVQWIWLSDHTPPDITCPPDVVKEWPGLITDWFASTATIVIDIDGSGPVSVDLSSAGLPPTQIERPYPPYNSGDQIPVEMVSLELVGSSPLGPVIVRLREDVPSPGTIVAIDTDSNGEFLFGDSFFDVFVEIETALGVLTTGEIPIQLSALGIDALPPVGSNFATAPGTEIPLLAPGAGQVGVLLQVIHNVEEEVPCDGVPEVFDNCDIDIEVTWEDELIPLDDCPNILKINRTFTATDDCGNSTSCVQMITYTDTTPPDITCPPDVVKEWPAQVTDWFTSTATIVINLDGNGPLTVDLSSTGLPPTQIERPYPPYNSGDQIPVEMVSLELAGDSPLGPVIVRLREDVPSPGTIVATDTDSDGELLFGDSFFDVFVEIETALGVLTTGEIPIPLSALGIDALPPVGSNFATSPDTEIPLLSPDGQVVGVLLQVIHNVEEEVPCDGVPEASDTCDDDLDITWEDEIIPLNDCPNVFKINRTFTATDDCGNSTSCVQMITLTDTTPPGIVCPSDQTVECDEEMDPDALGIALATDNCSDVSISYADVTIDGDCLAIGTVIRTWLATDVCGNTAECEQVITKIDTTSPTIICSKPAPMFCVDITPNAEWLIDNYVDVDDNCDPDPDIFWLGPSDITFGCMVSSTYEFYAIDHCGNVSDTCSIIVQYLVDFEVPDITCTDVPHLGCNPESKYTAQDLINEGFVTATDGCGPVAIGVLPTLDTAVIDCDTVVTYYFKASDFCNNQSPICSVEVRWSVDSELDLECPGDLTIECSDDDIDGKIQTWLGLASATDMCNDVTITNTFDADAFEYECNLNGVQDVTFTAVDDCGEVAVCIATISILDTTSPEITCPDDITANADKFYCDKSQVEIGFPTYTDNCDEDVTIYWERSDGEDIGAAYPVGVTEIQWIVVGECSGKSDTCVQTITIVDSQPPTVICTKIAVELNDDLGLVSVPDGFFYDGVFDNCTNEEYLLSTITISQNEFSCFDFPQVEVEVCATDEYGNTGCCFTTVKIQDNYAPVAVCQDVTVDMGANSSVTITPLDVDGGSTDNASLCDITLSVEPDEFFVIGDYDVTLTVTDIGGNVSECVSTVTVTGPSANENIQISGKIWLEGPLNQSMTAMVPTLLDVLPLNQPYGVAPFNYLGEESVAEIPSDVIDWVLIELRDQADPTMVLRIRAAFLSSTGYVVDLDGVSPVTFEDMTDGMYYLSIRHRNHLGVISDASIEVLNNVGVHDFTNGAAMGAEPMKLLSNGQYALWCGDLNADNVIDAGDRSIAWNMRNQVGYLQADATMDGVVDASERSVTWNNRNKVSGLPE